MQFQSCSRGRKLGSMTEASNTNAPAAADLAPPEILVTGATGFIGRWLLAALTRRGYTVAALVRGKDRRASELAAFVARIGGDARRLVVVEGDVEREDLGLGAALRSVRVVYHLAARFVFGATREEARRANVGGTENVMRWAHALPALDRFVFLGGYRMTAHPLASLDARAIDRHYAAGAYEGSKIEAYVRFRALADELGLAWTAVHPSGVIGDSRTGETTQITGLGETVERLFEGRMPALVGGPRTFVPVVTVDYLAELLATVQERAESTGRDLVVFHPKSPPLPALVKRLAALLGVDAPRFSLPVGLVRALPQAWTGLHPESASFLVEDSYDTRDADAHADAMKLLEPDLDQALARWCAFLVAARFLRREPPRDSVAFEDGSFVVGDPRSADVILLHGIPFDGEAMAPLAAALAARGVTSARLDLPGLGRSGPRASRTGAVDVEWLAARLAGRTRPAVLVGHSLGAALATRYAAAYPEAVRGLVLVAPAFLTVPASWTLRLSPVVTRVLGGLDARAFASRFLAERIDDASDEAVEQAIAALGRSGGAARYARALAEAAAAPARAAALRAFAAVEAPRLCIHARREHITETVEGTEIVTLDEAGHNPHLTHVAATARAIADFVGPGRDRASRGRHGGGHPPPRTSRI